MRKLLREVGRDEGGWVMVPAVVLLSITLALGAALALVVSVQSRAGGTQRSADASQTLAEGVISATANVMATDQSAATWPTTGACRAYTGTITSATVSGVDLASRITTEINNRFKSAYLGNTWRVTVCPVAGVLNGASWTQDAETWLDTYLTRTIASQPAGIAPTQISEWIRGEANVRGSRANLGATRAVVSKVKQSTVGFTPPADYAVGTGVFSTDVSTGLNSVLSNNTALLGGLTSNLLGTQPLIKSTSSYVGVRCGLLNTISATGVCLTGTLAGVGSVTNALGLQTLTNALVGDRARTLPTWTMAPEDAITAWKTEAQSSGVYKASVAGAGSDTAKSGASGAPECFSETTTATSVVYIKQVGTGEQYCTISGTRTAKIIIVERGAVRITGTVNAVVYALNKQECGADDTCDANEHKNAVSREVVRIEGPSGSVKGAVWADGAGGAVGIYPSFSPTSSQLVDAIAGPTCGSTLLTATLNVVTGALNIVGGLLGALIGKTQYRYPDGDSNNCSLLKKALAKKTPDELLVLYQQGGTVAVTTRQHRTCASLVLLGSCPAPGWPEWSSDSTDVTTVTIQPLLSDSTLVGQLITTLGGLNNTYTAVTYDAATVTNASAAITTGAGPVIGTYANVKRTS